MIKIERHHYAPTPAQRLELREHAAKIRAHLARLRVQRENERTFAAVLRDVQRPQFVRDVVSRAIAKAAVEIRLIAKTELEPLERFLADRFRKADERRFSADPKVITGFGEF